MSTARDDDPAKSYKKNDLIAVMKKNDKKDPIFLFQLSQNVDANSKRIRGVIYDKSSVSEKNKVNFEKGKTATIDYEDILAAVMPNLPQKDKDAAKTSLKRTGEFNKYFLSKPNYSKLLNFALENIQVKEKKEEDENEKKSIEIEEESSTQRKKRAPVKRPSAPKPPGSEKTRSKSKAKRDAAPPVEEATMKVEVGSEKEEKVVKKIKRSSKSAEKLVASEEAEEDEGKDEEEGKSSKKVRKSRKKSVKKEEGEGEEEEEEKAPTPKKKRSRKSVDKKKASEKKEKFFQKGKFNTKIENIEEVCEQLESKNPEIETSCCVKCTNKEFVRAAYTKNHKLLKKLLSSQQTVSTFYERWAPDLNLNCLEIIFKLEDKEALKEFLAALKSKKTPQFASLPLTTMREIQTGFNDQYAYGVRTRKVQLSRGGKEGNNALVYDQNTEGSLSQVMITRIFETCTNVEMIDMLRAAFPETQGMFDNQISTCVRSGNYKLAGYLISDLFKRGGYGYNKLHEEVLTFDDPSKLSPFKKVSTMKKTLGGQIITPIHCAAINPNADILKSLLDSSQEFSVPDEKQRKPVHYAAVCEDDGPLRHLIGCGVDTREGDQLKMTPLMLASQFGRTKNVACLLENESRANIGQKTRMGYSAIHFAAERGHAEILELLIEKKADVNAPGPSRMTPLLLAAAYGHYECVELLLEKGAKILVKDKFRRNALIMAVKNGNLKIASLLLQKGITFNESDSSKNFPLHYAAAYGFVECIELLMKAGADPNVFNSWNLTPLTVAMQKNHFGCVRKLLSYEETDVNCKDDLGRTLVSLSVATINESSLEHLKFLVIDKKADLNIADLKGWTPLHYAAGLNPSSIVYGLSGYSSKLKEHQRKKFIEKAKAILLSILKLFIENSKDINQISSDHCSAFSIAVANRNYEIAELLLTHPNFEIFRVSQADTCIFHDLAQVLIYKEGRALFHKVVDLMGSRCEEFLNMVDQFGFTPFLSFVRQYTSLSVSYYENLRQTLVSQKMAKLSKAKPEEEEEEGAEKEDEEERPQPPTKLTLFPSKAPRKAARKIGYMRSPSPISERNESGKALSTEELSEIAQTALKDFFENEEQFIELLRKMQGLGANVTVSVDKLKKYRENPNLIEEERLQQELKKTAQLPGIVQKGVHKSRPGRPFQQQTYDQPATKIRLTPYGPEGLQNALHLVMRAPSENLLNFLLGLKIETNALDDQNHNPLYYFVYGNGEAELFGYSKGNYKTNVELLRELLRLGMKPDCRDHDGNSPMLSAANSAKFEFVKVLCEYNSSLNIINNKGEVPLIHWVIQKNIKNVELLLRLGADPNFPDHKGRTALHHAVNVANADADASFEMESLLLQHNANINALDKNNRTPLHYAFVKIGQPFDNSMIDPVETVSSIVGVPSTKTNLPDKWGKTPLHYAAQRGAYISGIYLLNSKEVDIETKDIDKNTALAIAFINKQANFATLLIQRGANILNNLVNVPVSKKDSQNTNNNAYNPNFYNIYQPAPLPEDEDDEESDSENKNNNQMDLESESSASEASSLDNSPTAQPAAQNIWGNGPGRFRGNMGFQNRNRFGQYTAQDPEEDLKEGKSYSFFSAAIKYKWQGVSYLLIQQGYNILDAIESALTEKKFQLVLTLLSKKSDKASFQGLNAKKQNLFHLFAIHGVECSQEIMEKICREFKFRDIDPNQKDAKSRVPLHYSSSKGFTALNDYLLENGSNPEALDDQGNTPFSLLLQGNRSPKEYKFLMDYIKKGVNLRNMIKIKNQDLKLTPMLYVLSQGEKNAANLKWFLDHGSSVNEKDSKGCTPLIYAIKQNSKKLVNFFISQSHFEKALQIDNEGKNPLHYVVTPLELGSYENVEILKILAKIFDVKAKDSNGREPMVYALNQDSGKMVNTLLELGAQRKVKDLPRSGTSIITSVDWIEEELNFEDDAHKFIEKCIENDKKDQPVLDEKVKPDRYLTSDAHLEVLYDDVLGPYNLLMTKVDIKAGFYSEYVFYIMQILYDKNRDVYILFNRWGRIGTEGQYQQTPFSTREEVVKEFKKIFQQKSGNDWEKKDAFKKVSKKYQLIRTEKRVNMKEYLSPFDYKHSGLVKSELDLSILKIIKLFSDVKMYRDAMVSLSFQESNLPLAALDKSHLLEAKDLLNEMSDLIQQVQEEMKDFKKADVNNILALREKIASKSSRYYEIVPVNNYRAESIPPIDNEYQLYQQFRVIDSLLNFEITTKILLGAHYNFFKKNPLDYVFLSMNVRMLALGKNDPEFQLIGRYISNSHKTKNKFIKNIFALERKGEVQAFEPYKDLPNRTLLWHGSKTENFMGILAQGLKIAPPSATVTGHAFGRGVYFADTFEKSWAYANIDSSDKKYRFLLLCEVALGNMLEFPEYQQVNELDSKYQSVLGQGAQGPNPKQNIYLANATIMPVGKIIEYEKGKENKTRSLGYNEYIVFNEKQVRIRYLIQVNSKYA